VLLSLAFTTQLTFVLSPVFIGALVIAALAMWQITGDREALLFEGAALVGLYLILATLMWRRRTSDVGAVTGPSRGRASSHPALRSRRPASHTQVGDFDACPFALFCRCCFVWPM
jgi:hypothetical protein